MKEKIINDNISQELRKKYRTHFEAVSDVVAQAIFEDLKKDGEYLEITMFGGENLVNHFIIPERDFKRLHKKWGIE